MKALVYEGPETLAVTDVAEPVAGDGEVLIDVSACGICGSDMHAYHGHDARRPPPLILGHEASGTILEGPRAGERVTVNPLVTCGACPACKSGRTNICTNRQIISMPPREGAFAERLAIPERNVLPIPDNLPYEKAALTEPLACGWHAVRLAQQLAQVPLEQASAVVLGGGAIGLGAALVLAAHGVKNIAIAEPNTVRHAAIECAGDFQLYSPGAAGEPEPGTIDIVIDAHGNTATHAAACALTAPGGLIVHVGLAGGTPGLDVRRMTLQEITFVGTYTYTESDFRETLDAIIHGRLGTLDWIDQRPLANGPAAFRDIHNGTCASPKIVLCM